MSDAVAIILTTFNPDLSILKENLATYINQAQVVILCDNSDDCEISLQIEEICHGNSELIYLSMGGNQGIAYAQNRGVERAISEGFVFFIEIS